MKIAMVQMKVTAGDVAGNKERGLKLINEAALQADTIVLPEIWTIGYALKSVAEAAETMDGQLLTTLAGIASAQKVNIIAGSLPVKSSDKIYNCAIVIDKYGNVGACYQKVHLFSMYGEERFFAAGNKLCRFALDEATAGLGICYDLRFPELFRTLALGGALIVFVPAEWPAARGSHWRTLVQARAIENHMYVCAVNCVGEHKGSPFFGHSLLVSPDGEIVAEGGESEEIIYGDVDFNTVAESRKAMPSFNDRRPDLYLGV